MKSVKEIEQKYVDFDESTNCWGIFGDLTGFCFGLFGSEDEAKKYLRESYPPPALRKSS